MARMTLITNCLLGRAIRNALIPLLFHWTRALILGESAEGIEQGVFYLSGTIT